MHRLRYRLYAADHRPVSPRQVKRKLFLSHPVVHRFARPAPRDAGPHQPWFMTLVHSRRRVGRHRRRTLRPRHRTLITLLLAVGLVVLPYLSAQAQQAGAALPGDIEPRFDWPLSPDPPVTRNFEPPSHPYGPGHRGVDVGAEVGQDALAAGAGTVLFAGTVAGRGVVSIVHDGDIRTTYEPVRPAVGTGDQIHRGQAIGEVIAGHEACPASACLHWGALRSEEYLNPLRLVRPDTMLRLKPWDAPD